jgi:hypothetical protein
MKHYTTPPLQADATYTIRIDSHRTGHHLEIELDALPFGGRTFRIRVNGEAAMEKPYATKTEARDRLRKWMVAHGLQYRTRGGPDTRKSTPP